MNPFKFPLALIGFMGFALVMPPWMYFTTQYDTVLSTESSLLIGLVLPVLVIMYIASWAQPEGR
jgi:hypothetical protein